MKSGKKNMDPEEFTDNSKETYFTNFKWTPNIPITKELSPSEWISQYAGIQSKMWEDKDKYQRLETMVSSIVAYLEVEWLKNKKTPPV